MKLTSRYQEKAGQDERASFPSFYPHCVTAENSCGPSMRSVLDALDRCGEKEGEDPEAQMEIRWCRAQA